jgi:mutator protein MutT
MKAWEIKKKLEDHKPGIIEVDRASAVMIPLVETEDGLSLLFEKRANGIRQGGEVCFPGGRIDPGEKPEQTALREMEEELGLPPHRVALLGQFDTLHNYTGVTIHTFVGQIAQEDLSGIVLQESEVAQVFLVPLKFFLDHKPYIYDFQVLADIKEDFPYHMVDSPHKYDWIKGRCNVPIWNYGEHSIWGLTARIVVHFLKTFCEL